MTAPAGLPSASVALFSLGSLAKHRRCRERLQRCQALDKLETVRQQLDSAYYTRLVSYLERVA